MDVAGEARAQAGENDRGYAGLGDFLHAAPLVHVQRENHHSLGQLGLEPGDKLLDSLGVVQRLPLEADAHIYVLPELLQQTAGLAQERIVGA